MVVFIRDYNSHDYHKSKRVDQTWQRRTEHGPMWRVSENVSLGQPGDEGPSVATPQMSALA
jgi:hypothetical protein